MDFLEEKLTSLDTRRGRINVDSIGVYCSQYQLFEDIYSMTTSCSDRRRGSIFWVLAKAVCNRTWHPNKEILEELVLQLDKETDVMTKRCLLDIFQYAPLPVHQLGKLTDTCIRLMSDRKETIAVRAFSITVLLRIIEQYPELYNEVKGMMEELSIHGSPAIRGRAKKAINSMDKIS